MIDPTTRKLLSLPESARELTHYALLGLTPKETTPEAVKAACKKRSKQLQAHGGDPQLKGAIAAMAKQILAAANVLADRSKRIEYDHELDVRRQRVLREGRKKFRAAVQMALVKGKLPAKKVKELMGRAEQIGIADVEAQRILETFPVAKASAKDPSAESSVVDPLFNLDDLANADDEMRVAPDEEVRLRRSPQAKAVSAATQPLVPHGTLLAVKILMGLSAASALVSLFLVLTAP
jgi:hypothetical protein